MEKQKSQKWMILLAILLAAGIGAVFVIRDANQMIQNARAMKADMTSLSQCLLQQDLDGAQQTLDEIYDLSVQTQTKLQKPFWKLAGRFAETEYSAVQKLLPLMDKVTAELIEPVIRQMRRAPLSELKGEGGINTEQLTQWMAFVQQKLPAAKSLADELEQIPLGRLDQDGKLKELTDGMQESFDLLDEDTMGLVTAFMEQLEQYPLDHIQTGGGINVTLAANYLGFVRKMMPQLEQLMDKLESHQKSLLLQNKLVSEYCGKAQNLLTLYRENQDLAQLAEVILSSEKDQYFLIPALNASETRAIGGFPGAIGAVTIQNGVLELEGFYTVRAMLNPLFPYSVTIPHSERQLFHSPLSDPQRSWDACHSPDFEWVAKIWAASHEERLHQSVDGVIAMNPTVIQRILAVTGPVKLSDGTILDGENATKTLERDLYFRYFNKNASIGMGNNIVDALFAETAKKTMDALIENLKVDKLPALLDAARETVSNRNAMVWMKDETAQQVVRDLGFSGGFDMNPDTAELGIYFNCTTASKMGWFAGMQTEIGTPAVQEDGSSVYPVTVTVSNSITREEINQAGDYILGGGSGRLYYAMYLFAPREAEIRQVTFGEHGHLGYAEYQRLKVASLKSLSIAPGENVEIHFELITPQGFDRPLVIAQTPLLQDYH